MSGESSLRRQIKKGRLRPTSNKVREALFNILGDRIVDAVFLDLYAGTGAVGVVALQRGAARVVFVESMRRYAAEIEDRLRAADAIGRARIITRKALPFLESAKATVGVFDVIFLDPPYHGDELGRALRLIGKLPMLHPEGIVVAEHSGKTGLPERCEHLRKIKDYHYGDTVLSLYKAEAQEKRGDDADSDISGDV